MKKGWGCRSFGRASDRHADAGYITWCYKGLFSQSQLSVQDSLTVSALARVRSHVFTSVAHVKDPVVHVGVRWIMETLKHPACTIGLIARLCRSWLSLGKAIRISYGRNPNGTIQLERNHCSFILNHKIIIQLTVYFLSQL